MNKKIKVAISAGETSGDQRGYELVNSMRLIDEDIEFKGMGMSKLSSAGVELIVDASKTGSVMGITEVIGSLNKVYTSLKAMKRFLRTWHPSLLILIDYPDFNLRLAKYAHSLNIPILYYIPPKVWAWREGRIKKLKKYCNGIATIFPFEEQFYKNRKIQNVKYVGHPFSSEFTGWVKSNRKEYRGKFGFSEKDKIISVLPGSRQKEIEKNLQIMLEGINSYRNESTQDVKAIISIPVAFKDFVPNTFQIDKYDWARLSFGDSLENMAHSNLGLLKCGTCNLEAVFLNLPQIVVYKASLTTAKIIEKYVKLKEFSIVNIIRPGCIKELIQDNFTVKNVSSEISHYIDNIEAQNETKKEYKEIIDALQTESKSSTDVTANYALNLAKDKVSPNGIYRRLLDYLKHHKFYFVIALICMIIFGATDGAVPFLIKYVLDKVFSAQNRNFLYLFPIVLLVISLIRAISDFGQQYLMSKVGHLIVQDLRTDMNKKFLSLDPSYFIHQSSGDLLSRVTGDVLLIRTLLTESFASVIRDSIRIVVLLISAIYLDPFLAFISVFVFPIGVLPVQKFGKKIRRLSKRGQEEIGKISDLLHESIQGNKVVKIFCREEYEIEKFTNENTKLTNTLIKSEKIKALTGPANELIASIAIGVVIFYGGSSVIAGTRTQGDFIAFLIALFLLYDPFKKLSKISSNVQQGMAGAFRIFEIFDTEPKVKNKEVTVPANGIYDIKFQNVSYKYNSKQYALNNINFHIKEGEKVALVGLSGSGKSTLVDLLPRFIDPTDGEIYIGNINLKDLDLNELRSKIAMVGQHTFLFNSTIYENIRYGNLDATEEMIIKATKEAYAFDFIEKLPNKFHSLVGEGGFTLSGGERQRIAIARALLKDAPILILDEATASLDNHSENVVQLALEKLQSDRTTLIIAHRLSTIINAERIFVLKNGDIVEEGIHESLLEKKGEYFNLFSYQFKNNSNTSTDLEINTHFKT